MSPEFLESAVQTIVSGSLVVAVLLAACGVMWIAASIGLGARPNPRAGALLAFGGAGIVVHGFSNHILTVGLDVWGIDQDAITAARETGSAGDLLWAIGILAVITVVAWAIVAGALSLVIAFLQQRIARMPRRVPPQPAPEPIEVTAEVPAYTPPARW